MLRNIIKSIIWVGGFAEKILDYNDSNPFPKFSTRSAASEVDDDEVPDAEVVEEPEEDDSEQNGQQDG